MKGLMKAVAKQLPGDKHAHMPKGMKGLKACIKKNK